MQSCREFPSFPNPSPSAAAGQYSFQHATLQHTIMRTTSWETWSQEVETLSTLLALCEGNPSVTAAHHHEDNILGDMKSGQGNTFHITGPLWGESIGYCSTPSPRQHLGRHEVRTRKHFPYYWPFVRGIHRLLQHTITTTTSWESWKSGQGNTFHITGPLWGESIGYCSTLSPRQHLGRHEVRTRKHFPYYWPFVRGIHRLLQHTITTTTSWETWKSGQGNTFHITGPLWGESIGYCSTPSPRQHLGRHESQDKETLSILLALCEGNPSVTAAHHHQDNILGDMKSGQGNTFHITGPLWGESIGYCSTPSPRQHLGRHEVRTRKHFPYYWPFVRGIHRLLQHTITTTTSWETWSQDKETLSILLALCEGNPSVTAAHHHHDNILGDMKSGQGNTFHITGPLWGESIGYCSTPSPRQHLERHESQDKETLSILLALCEGNPSVTAAHHHHDNILGDMKSGQGNTFHITGPLWGESIGYCSTPSPRQHLGRHESQDKETLSILLALCEGNPSVTAAHHHHDNILGDMKVRTRKHFPYYWPFVRRIHRLLQHTITTTTSWETWVRTRKHFPYYWPFVRGIHRLLPGRHEVRTRKHFPYYWPFVRGIHRLLQHTITTTTSWETWSQDKETLSILLALCEGNPSVTAAHHHHDNILGDMKSGQGNTFHITGPLWGESIGYCSTSSPRQHLGRHEVRTRKHFPYYWPFVRGIHWLLQHTITTTTSWETWSQDKETLSILLALCEGNPSVTAAHHHHDNILGDMKVRTRKYFPYYWPFVRGIHRLLQHTITRTTSWETWSQDKETLSILLALCEGNPSVTAAHHHHYNILGDMKVRTRNTFHITGPLWGESIDYCSTPSPRQHLGRHESQDKETLSILLALCEGNPSVTAAHHHHDNILGDMSRDKETLSILLALWEGNPSVTAWETWSQDKETLSILLALCEGNPSVTAAHHHHDNILGDMKSGQGNTFHITGPLWGESIGYCSTPSPRQHLGRHEVRTRKHFPYYWPFVRGIHRLLQHTITRTTSWETWSQDKETLSILLDLCERNPPVTVGFPQKVHIKAETKWPPFCRRHFQVHFCEWKC